MKRTHFSFGHPDFTLTEGRLKYFSASHTTVLVGSAVDGIVHKLCQITFNRVGSILAQFTYFGSSDGIVAAWDSVPGTRNHTVRFSEVGLAASKPVKYSHPPDGMAHFSQDGSAISKVRRQSFPLEGSGGHLFELHSYLVDGFEKLVPGQEKKKRLYLPWIFTQPVPEGVIVVAEWKSKKAVLAESPEGNEPIGPLTMLQRPGDGRLFKAMLVGQPQGYPLQDHVLVINVGAIPKPANVDRMTMVFLGGWDDHSVSKDPMQGTGYLTFMYPAGDIAELKKAGRTIDWLGPQ